VNVHGSKVMLCIWWNYLGIGYYAKKPSETIIGDLYQKQSNTMCLSGALKDKQLQYNERHDKVILQHDNARQCYKIGQNIIGSVEMGSPTRRFLHTLLLLTIICFDQWDTAWPSSIYEEVKNWIDTCIASKDEQLFRRGICTPERWKKVMPSDGQYFES